MRAAELGRVAAKNFRNAPGAQRLDVRPDQRPRLGALLDEKRKTCAARERLEPERAGAREQVEHARVRHRIAVTVEEHVEQAFAQPVGGRTDRSGFRAREISAAPSAPDDAHQRTRSPGRSGSGACPWSSWLYLLPRELRCSIPV